MRRIRWTLCGDSAAMASEDQKHPAKPRILAWVSVADPDDLHRCMIGVERALDYCKAPKGGERDE